LYWQVLSRIGPPHGRDILCKRRAKTLTKSALRFVDCLVYSTRRMLI
jgi:hypothetical protein